MSGRDLLDDHQRLVITPVGEARRVIETQADPVVTVWAAEQATSRGNVALPGNLLPAERTGRDVTKRAVRADRWEHRPRDVAALLTRFPQRLAYLPHLDPAIA